MPRNWIADDTRNAITARDGMRCCYCLKKCVAGSVAGMTAAQQKRYAKEFAKEFATLDHIIARESVAIRYGRNSAEYKAMLIDPCNLVTVCCACNSSKRHSDLKTWCEKKGYSYTLIVKRIKRRIAKGI